MTLHMFQQTWRSDGFGQNMAFLQAVEVQTVPQFLSVSADDGVFWSYMACQNMAAGPGHRTSLRDSMRACAVVGSHHRLLYLQ